jgi:transcriptional regulator with XRE-family HTH domain
MKAGDIRKHREARGFTQEYIADRLNVDISTVYRWEADMVAPSLRNTQYLIDILVKKDAFQHPLTNRLIHDPQALAVADIFGVYRKANSAFENITGVISSDLVGQTVSGVFPNLVELSEGRAGVGVAELPTSNFEVLEVRAPGSNTVSHPLVHSLEVLRQVEFTTVVLHSVRLSKEDTYTPGVRALRRL